MFLKPHTHVVSTQNRDYPEWHLGRMHYALWYVLLEQERYPELVAALDQLRLKFVDVLFPQIERQYHITLYICGFLTHQQTQYNDDFRYMAFEQQKQQLQQISSFQLNITHVNSFQSALFVHVEDDRHDLLHLREQLKLKDHQEVAALHYHPHITLGLYRKRIDSNEILKRLQQSPSIDMKINIDQLHFGYYHAQQLQGPLHSLDCLELD